MAPGDIEQRQDASAAAASPSAANTTVYYAIGGGVGGAIFLALIGVGYALYWKKKKHRRALAEMEQGGAASAAISPPSRNMEQHLPGLVTGMRCGQMVPHSQAWDALASNETLNEPRAVANPNFKRLRSSVSLPKKFRNRGLQFGRNKYLSAIVELDCPISANASPELPQSDTMAQEVMVAASSHSSTVDHGSPAHTRVDQQTVMDTCTFARSASPNPDAVPSFARRSQVTHDTLAMNDDRLLHQATRSASAGLLSDSTLDDAVFGHAERNPYRLHRPESHYRSLSLGAPTSRPPSGPVPPLPARSPLRLMAEFDKTDDVRQGTCISRMSSSTIDSASSSVLATSPVLTRDDGNDALHSPTLEDVVAQDQHASLKTVPNRQWQIPRVSGPRSSVSNSASKIQKSGSVRGSIIRFSSDSLLTREPSSASTESEESARKQRLSIAQIGTANSIVMSRVPSTNSSHGSVGGVQKVSTPPRKTKRQTSVSASGSPAERRRTSVLRDISGNATNTFTANRESSDSTLNSGRSSCGNPFQWDPSAATLAVPSALKGSPNARKGHRRQNCVRISTLTPQVLGPAARSRSASPARTSLMGRIKEERESDELHRREDGQENEAQLTMQNSRPTSMRQSSNLALPGNLRIQTLRASLTPDSPTLSAWNAYQKAGLTTTGFDDNLSVSPDGSRAGSRQSDRSSGIFMIPKFPSPSKARASLAVVNHDAPLPEFSMDYAEDKHVSPRARRSSSASSSSSELSPVSPMEMTMPSSPPLRVSAKTEYDPAWPMITLPMPSEHGREYDPASPPSMMWDATNPERSSWFLPFATGNMFESNNETNTTPGGRAAAANSPPCSPKSSPSGAAELPEVETLTSSNASKMMIGLPPTTNSGALGLNSIPILLPPTTSEDPACQLPEWKTPAAPTHHSAPRPRRVTSTGSPNRIRRRSPEPFMPSIAQSSSPPPSPAFQSIRPLNIQTVDVQVLAAGPKGPRNAPAKSVLNNVSALRRMNSECDKGTPNRQSRNWKRLGREASLLLPYTGGLLPTDESSNSLFDFDFGTRTSGQHTRAGAAENDSGEPGSAMDEIDASTFDRMLDGALAGFDAEFKRWSGGKDTEGKVEEGEKKRAASIWDDGEHFWGVQQDTSQTPPSYKIHPAEATPRKSAEQTSDPRMLAKSPPGTMANTPMSLYDADGFLRT